MRIPSVDYWTRKEFLVARRKQMDHQKKIDLEEGPNLISVYTEHDEIICDTCNAEIEDLWIRLVDFGRRVACMECFRKFYADKEITYRVIENPGGKNGNG